jgi:hypothetical protein
MVYWRYNIFENVIFPSLITDLPENTQRLLLVWAMATAVNPKCNCRDVLFQSSFQIFLYN